jgi:hypothetical protein
MRGWIARIGAIGLALGAVAASGDTPVSVVSATPGIDGAAIARFTWRFSNPMVPLGGGAAPLAIECPVGGRGRWVDPATYVHEFDRPLPGGLSCRATLRPDLRTEGGASVAGTQTFPINSGGPFARATMPGDGEIEEDQAFFVAPNGPVDRASVSAGAYCAVDGIGERIAVDLLPARHVDAVLTSLRDDYRRDSFLERAGLPVGAGSTGVVGLKCRRPLPPGRDVSLVWPGSIRSPAGRMAGEERRFDYTVRSAFSAKLTCPRTNARSGCSPVEPVSVAFTAPVPRAMALAVRLEVEGRLVSPTYKGSDAALSSLRFEGPFTPSTTGRLIMPDDLRDESGRPLSNARRFPLDVAIAQAPPLVKFAAPFGILEAKEGGVLPVTVRAVEPSLMQSVAGLGGGTARIAPDDAQVAHWLRRVNGAQDDDYRDERRGGETVSVNHTGAKSVLDGAPGVQRMRLDLPAKGRQFEVVGVPLKNPGFYVVELASPVLGRALLGRPAKRYVAAAALVTDMAVHFKWGRTSSLAWVTSLSGGTPVADAEIRVSDACTGRLMARGATDRSGRLLIRGGLPEPSSGSGCNDGGHPLIVSARGGGDYSFTLTSWGNGISPQDFELPYGWSAPEPTFHTVFDRTLLRAGETVNMKHIHRAPTATGFRSPGPLAGSLQLQHRGSETVFELPVALGANGIGETRWTAPKGAPAGDYELRLKVGETITYTTQSFRVDEYRLPTMRASVSGPKKPVITARRVPLDLYVGYLSGGGAGRAPVRLRTAYDKLSDTPEGWEGWTFGGDMVRVGSVPLDEENQPREAAAPPASTTPLTLDGQGSLRTTVDLPELTGPTRLTVEMDYDDANGETLTASTSILVHGAALRVGIKPDGWMQRDDDLRLKVTVLGLDGAPSKGRRVAIALYTREILSARRRLIGGFYAYDNTARTTRISASCSEATDAQGLATCALKPGVSGEVIAVATAQDGDGRKARATTSVYLAGEDEWWFGGDNGDRMDVVPDQRAYPAGGTARVQVRMPFRSATALVTVEREGVLSSFVTTLSGRDPVVSVPLPGAYAPDVFISVTAVRGRIGGWRLWLADLARRWNLPFLSREGGSPTALVDLAKPSYRIGIAKVKVGADAHRLRVAVKTDHARYHVRESATADVRVLAPDGKPPRSAEIAFAAVDEALLQLQPNPSWDVLDAMMGERPLSVLTSTGQMQVVGKRHFGRKAVAAGGGGGGDMSALTRADFRPVLLWRGRVPLDAQGRARLRVPLADSLSSYRLVAIATGGANLFGTGSAGIRTMQDLAIYAGVPPLVRSGDQYGAVFTLRNGSDRAMTVTASVDVFPQVARGRPLNVTIPAGGAAPVAWQLVAPSGVDQLRWTVSARTADGRAADRMVTTQAVVPAVPEQVWAATFFRVGPDTSVPIAMPVGALPGRGGVEVVLSASPVPSMADVQAYMRAYPYTCFEQRLSRAVVLGNRGMWNAMVSDLPTYIDGRGLLRYWPESNMTGSVALTAYALSMTAETGLRWPGDARGRLLDAMRGVVDGRIGEEDDLPGDRRLLRLAALAALARHGQASGVMLGQVAIPLADMPTATLADWLVTLDRTPGASPAQRAAAEQALRGRIVFEGTRLDLVDRAGAPWWMMVSDDEMALKALLAATGRPGWEADAPRMMVGAALRRRQGHWDTTPANAWATVAVGRFASAYPGAPTGVTSARLGAQSLSRTWPSPAAMRFAPARASTPLVLSHQGAAGPWATVSVRAAVPLRAPRFSGYRVTRQVSFVQRKRADAISRGDVMRVRITVDAPVDRTWVVIEDPLPAGSSVISGGQSAILARQAGDGSGSYPSYIDRGLDAWRGYYGWMPKGRTTTEYVLRINASGVFQMPPTRVEAMYSPEINAALPNRPMMVKP